MQGLKAEMIKSLLLNATKSRGSRSSMHGCLPDFGPFARAMISDSWASYPVRACSAESAWSRKLQEAVGAIKVIPSGSKGPSN